MFSENFPFGKNVLRKTGFRKIDHSEKNVFGKFSTRKNVLRKIDHSEKRIRQGFNNVTVPYEIEEMIIEIEYLIVKIKLMIEQRNRNLLRISLFQLLQFYRKWYSQSFRIENNLQCTNNSKAVGRLIHTFASLELPYNTPLAHFSSLFPIGSTSPPSPSNDLHIGLTAKWC